MFCLFGFNITDEITQVKCLVTDSESAILL